MARVLEALQSVPDNRVYVCSPAEGQGAPLAARLLLFRLARFFPPSALIYGEVPAAVKFLRATFGLPCLIHVISAKYGVVSVCIPFLISWRYSWI